jgi:uncharacterized LabA/DUF88 family protein
LTTQPKDLIKRMFLPSERLAIFVDGANIHQTLKLLDFQLDYTHLRTFFGEMGRLLRCYYYTAMKPEGHQDPLKPMVDFLAKNGGWTVITKPLRFMGPHGSDYTMKGNMDIEIAVDMIQMSAFVDHLVLFTGDGDFRYLVEHLQDRGKRVSVVSTQVTKTPVMSVDLLKQADNFIELDVLKAYMARDPKERTRAALANSRPEA